MEHRAQQGTTAFPGRIFPLVGLIASLLSLAACLAMMLLFDSDIFYAAPGAIRSIVSDVPSAALIALAGVLILASAATSAGLYFQGRSRAQTGLGMIATVALALLGMTMFLVAAMYREVFVLMQRQEAAKILLGAIPAVLAMLCCASQAALSAVYGVRAGGAALPLSILAALLFAAALAMLGISFIQSLESAFYRPLSRLWMLAPGSIFLSVAALARGTKRKGESSAR